MQVVTEAQIRRHVTAEPIIDAVETAFRALGQGHAAVFPVARGHGTDPAHTVSIKSGLDAIGGLIGVKVASYHPGNRTAGRKAHTSTILLIDDSTAEVIAVIEAGYLNGLRTAAANAAAVRHLAREDARVLGVLGTGAQAAFEVEAVCAVRPIDTLMAGARSASGDASFAAAVAKATGLTVQFTTVRAVVEAADILVTASPARAPLFEADWIRPGTHVSAMGVDNVGKQELPVALLTRADFYMDHPPQALRLGEGQHLVAAGYDERALADRSLGALLCGRIAGRTHRDAITVFDSTGLAIQDIAAAQTAWRIVATAEARAER